MSLSATFGIGHDRPPKQTADDPAHDAEIRKAYERGRRDERARRRRNSSPLFTLVLLLAAGAGATVIYMGVQQGSFARGGQVVDQNIDSAVAPATQAAQNTRDTVTKAAQGVTDEAADTLENAGRHLKQATGG